jgi:hypothetical protein
LARNSVFSSLLERNPSPTTARLLSDLVPPREFESSSFTNYIPHAEYSSQAVASEVAKAFALGKSVKKSLFSRGQTEPEKLGIYLDSASEKPTSWRLPFTHFAARKPSVLSSLTQA